MVQIRARSAPLSCLLSLVFVLATPEPCALAQCPAYDAGVVVGTVESDQVNEASGLVASLRNANVFWAHNDSGDSPRVFAMNAAGDHLGIYSLQGAGALDWEDIAIGPGPGPGVSYLYLGDIGDNLATRPNVVIYRVAEPAVDDDQSPVNANLTDVDAITLTYPGGLAHNAEALLVDPVTGDLFIVAKEAPGDAQVFRKAAPHVGGRTATMTAAGSVTIGPWVTGGDVSPQGDRIILRTYGTACVWPRDDGQTVDQALAGAGCPVPLASEPQGEAIAFGRWGDDYFTVSEQLFQPIYRFVGRYAGVAPDAWRCYR